MSKNQDKKSNLKVFLETRAGKFVKVISIIGCVLVVTWIAFALFEFIVNRDNLNVNNYQSIMNVAEFSVKYGIKYLFISLIFILPEQIREDKKMALTSKKEKNILDKLVGSPWLKLAVVIILIEIVLPYFIK